MKQKLIAMAVAAAVLAPTAASADMTVFGKLDVSYNIVDHDAPAGSDGSYQDISSNSSSIGFKGSEDLGGGLKAIWHAQTKISVDDTNEPFNKNTYVGLAGDFGQVRIGRHDSPFKLVRGKVDLFESQQLGENRVLAAPSAGDIGWDKRFDETIAYFTPDFNGFNAAVAYVPEQEIEDGDAWSLAGFYANGPLLVGVGYEVHNEGLTPGTEDESAWRLAGAYTFGDFKVTGLYQSVKDDGGADDADFDVWGLGGQYTFGSNAIKLQYYDRDEYDNADDTGASVWAVGFDHNFTKRTKIYANYASVNNDDMASFSIDSSGFDDGSGRSDASGVEAGGDSAAFSIGVRHKF